jgi:predicted nucleic acid-binding protein
LSDEEALSLAQALDSNANMVVVESEEAKTTAVELGIRPLTYEDFLLDAFRRGLIKAKEILKTLL